MARLNTFSRFGPSAMHVLHDLAQFANSGDDASTPASFDLGQYRRRLIVEKADVPEAFARIVASLLFLDAEAA